MTKKDTKDAQTQVNVRMSADFKEKCDSKASLEGVSLNEWMRRAMQERLEPQGKTDFSQVDKDIFIADLLPRIQQAVERVSAMKPSADDPKLRADTVNYLAHQKLAAMKKQNTGVKFSIISVNDSNERGKKEGGYTIRMRGADGSYQDIPRDVSSVEIEREIASRAYEILLFNNLYRVDIEGDE